jgi:long-chain-fatty-acid--CoA ligase ACSBG
MSSVSAEIGNGVIQKRIENQNPGQCCNLVYTSGTTGKPKAVMLSHDNLSWTWQLYNNMKYEDVDSFPKPIKIVSFLPLSHITAQMADFSRQLVLRRPVQVTFAPQRILQYNLLHETLQFVRPTEFMAVPRVYEKFEERLKHLV